MTRVPRFDPASMSSAANETFSVRRVFGEAYERDGVTVIPVARIWAATGLGVGDGEGGGSLPQAGPTAAAWARHARAVWSRASGERTWDDEEDVEPAPTAADSGSADTAPGDTDPTDAEHGTSTARSTSVGHGGYGGGHGGGGGYGARVKAVGVYVIDADGVHWRPALDLNRVILGGQLVAVTAVASLGAALAVKAVAGALAKAAIAFAER